jgi:hypothetical protein
LLGTARNPANPPAFVRWRSPASLGLTGMGRALYRKRFLFVLKFARHE